jgi:enterochelin esterase family protein
MSMSALGPAVDATEILFRLRVPDDAVRYVRLCQQITRPRVGPVLRPVAAGSRNGERIWHGRMVRPAVDRLEYQYELEFTDGTRQLTLDPHNPLRAAGPFGDTSVVEMPGYQPPDWCMSAATVTGRFLTLQIRSEVLGATVRVGLWTSPALDVEHEAPLIIAHDGPEYDRYSRLLQFISSMIDAGRIPAVRVLLLPAVDRNEHYAASPAYARALARELVPLFDWLAPQPRTRRDGRPWRVGVGASLGGLATLHGHRLYPDIFGGMFLQDPSGAGGHDVRHRRGEPGQQPAHARRVVAAGLRRCLRRAPRRPQLGGLARQLRSSLHGPARAGAHMRSQGTGGNMHRAT